MFVKLKKELRRSRNQEPRFAKTPDWVALKPLLDAAARDPKKRLKPGEEIGVQLTDAEKAKYRIKSRRTIFRFIQQYVAALSLPYTVRSFRHGDHDYVLVRAED